MGLWWRMVLVTAVVLTPGGFLLLVGYVAVRTLRTRWLETQARGQPARLRDVLGSLHVKDLIQEARAAL